MVLLALLLPLSAFAGFESDLQSGSKGSDVLSLQNFLTKQGFYTGPITGSFFALTKAAVQKFQASKGIEPVSGYFGPKTRLMANQLLVVLPVQPASVPAIVPPILPPSPIVIITGVSLLHATGTASSVHIEYDTNIPTDSKIFIPINGVTSLFASKSSTATHHIIDIVGLNPSTQYSYSIEAINGQLSSKYAGTFTTKSSVIATLTGSIVTIRSSYPIVAGKTKLVNTASRATYLVGKELYQAIIKGTDGMYPYSWAYSNAAQKDKYVLQIIDTEGNTIESPEFIYPGSVGWIQ